VSNQLEFSDLIGIVSLYLGMRNLTENEQQSDAQIKILRQNDVGAANDRQAAYLLQELGRKFDEQNAMLERILEAVKK
jgi:hypothetical protein